MGIFRAHRQSLIVFLAIAVLVVLLVALLGPTKLSPFNAGKSTSDQSGKPMLQIINHRAYWAYAVGNQFALVDAEALPGGSTWSPSVDNGSMQLPLSFLLTLGILLGLALGLGTSQFIVWKTASTTRRRRG